MLKKFTFWLSKNTEFTTSLDVFLSLFLLFSLCLDEVPPICWMKLPNVDEIPPNHIRKKNVFFLHIHEANMGSSLVVLYTSLWLVEGVYKPQACVGWASDQCNRTVHVNQTYLFGQSSPKTSYKIFLRPTKEKTIHLLKPLFLLLTGRWLPNPKSLI